VRKENSATKAQHRKISSVLTSSLIEICEESSGTNSFTKTPFR